MGDDVSDLGLREPTVTEIILATCAVFGIERRELLSKRKTKRLARPRQLAMYLGRELTSRSLPEIAACFGRDHTTVVHSCRVVPGFLREDEDLRELGRQVESLALQNASKRPRAALEPLDLTDLSTLISGLRELSQSANDIANLLQSKAGGVSAVCGRSATTSESGNATEPELKH